MLQVAVLVLLLIPEHCLAPWPVGRGLVQERVSVIVRLPDPQVLEHADRRDSLHADHPPCTETVSLHYCSVLRALKQSVFTIVAYCVH